jgi:hypothetical protein
MTPHQYKLYVEREVEKWHVPLSNGNSTLQKGVESMSGWRLEPRDIPLIIKLVENPNYKTSKLFTGAVNLFTHDCVHVLLGRGVLLKDEAFVIGYTMGSSKKMSRWRRNLFLWICKYLYPRGYKFGEEERYVFYSGVMAGSKCPTDLSKVDFKNLLDYKAQGAREKLGIDKEILKCYYCVEKRLFNDKESQRLL